MLIISDDELAARMRFDNPWWDHGAVPDDVARMPERDYFDGFMALIDAREPRRAVVLMGPRRVGKTIMMQQAIKRRLASGTPAQNLLYVSLDTPLFSGIPLDRLFSVYAASYGGIPGDKTIFFDEVQYLKDWQVHLKALVDSRREVKFVVSGSAAAALARGSQESGAGRFSDFRLPPLTFAEYLRLTGHPLGEPREATDLVAHIADLNVAFVDYLNFGGYPELATSPVAQANPARFLGHDIVEKVLLRDLPSLYGISDVQELQHLFKVLAFNSGQEVSLEGLSKASSVSKNTLKRYVEYLEAAFLVRRVERIDINANRFRRNHTFKVYLTNPCLRTALFGPVHADDPVMGAMVETAIYSQWFHEPGVDDHLRYARDADGEVDIVSLKEDGRPDWAVEVKWSDRFFAAPGELKALRLFARKHRLGEYVPLLVSGGRIPVSDIVATTRTKHGRFAFDGGLIDFFPSAIYCLMVGRNTVPHAIDGASSGRR